jgi:hypothetical protein
MLDENAGEAVVARNEQRRGDAAEAEFSCNAPAAAGSRSRPAGSKKSGKTKNWSFRGQPARGGLKTSAAVP